MKPFETYQYLAGEEMTPRDKTEVGSKFWNEGKWNNFVRPFLPERGDGLTFGDMGCNAGLFLSFAEEMGFSNVYGVDSNREAVERGQDWARSNNKRYSFFLMKMEDSLKYVPVTDYVVLANAHYYFKIDDWLRFLDKLRTKARFCIVVTTKKRPGNRCWAQADVENVRRYFKDWEEVGFIDALPVEGDPRPRHLYGFNFKSPLLERVKISDLDSGNHVQDKFYREIDGGNHYTMTKYYHIIRKYRLEDRKDWDEAKLKKFFEDRVALYNDIQDMGLKDPIIVDSSNKILDGNHRCQMLKHLGHESVIVRRV